MLLPSDKPLFENVSSRDFYARAGELKGKKIDGCVHIIFPDFEETIIFLEGQAVTAVHEAKRWLTVGDELVEVAENKAMSAQGRMSAYQLPPELLHIFIHKSVKTMVETGLGPFMTAKLLIGYLETDKSTCVLKLHDGRATGYVYINFGKRVGAAYVSPDGQTYDDKAIKDMDGFKEHTTVAIYYTELTEKYLRAKAAAKAEVRAPGKPEAPAAPAMPAEPIKTPEPVAPVEAAKPAVNAISEVKPVPAKPAAPKPAGIRLTVAMSEDRIPGLVHRSRQQTLEALEEGDVAWVDGTTLTSLHMADHKASIVLPDGREHRVTIKEMDIQPTESRHIILPRKLRNRLSIDRGTMVEVKA